MGDRARKLDQGILITRFELPFNIWWYVPFSGSSALLFTRRSGTCNNHIGMGVRYNAEKKKIGNYYSTPIYSFRCKCHLCDGWFEIQTDPKVRFSRPVVPLLPALSVSFPHVEHAICRHVRGETEGGGLGPGGERWLRGAWYVHRSYDPHAYSIRSSSETDPNAGPVDPLAALEKSTNAQNYVNQVQVPRLEALQSLSDHYGTDPYSLSRKARKRFREEKKVELAKQELDDKLKSTYGLPETLALPADSEESRAEARELWQEEKQRAEAKRRKLSHDTVVVPSRMGKPSSSVRVAPVSKVRASSASSAAVSSLRAKILANTAQRSQPLASSGKLKPPDVKSGILRR